MTRFFWDAALFVLASPVLFILWLRRAWKRCRYYRVAYSPRIRCRTCGNMVELLGAWRCACGYTTTGHLLRVCPVCRSLPRMARCLACGATEVLPQL